MTSLPSPDRAARLFIRVRCLACCVAILLGFDLAVIAAPPEPLRSPDGRIEVTFRMPGADEGPARPRWSASLGGRPVLEGGEWGWEIAGAGDILAGARLIADQRSSADERVPVPFGRADHVDDRYRQVRLTFESNGNRRVEVVVRCYDDAVAFRYELPAGDGGRAPATKVSVIREATSFRAAGEPEALVQYLENFRTSHEHPVDRVGWRGIRPGVLLDVPLTLAWPDGRCVAITEAGLRHYAGMSLRRGMAAEDGDALVVQLTPRPDGTAVVGPLPLRTPWRVALIADRPGALLESGTLHALNDPPAIGDTSWIKPGKITFHWWNGDVWDGKPGLPILSVEMARRYIDFCARHGIEAHAMSSTEGTTTPWYRQSKPGVEPGPDTDVTRPRDGFELAEIRRYADSKGVRLWTWVHQAALRGRVEEAFAAFERMGWKGMMVDFFDHDDQDSVEFAEAVLQAAARHRILIHLHGIWKPTGWERTYPNLMNHEGALNLEYLKWSDRCPPEHDVMMAFTRLIAGPMDYHLGGFRAVPRAEFRPRMVAPNVLGTRGHMLAMYVCFDNPTPMVADYPVAYEGQTGFDFLKRVPTWWDETRVLVTEVGRLLVTARRRGDVWYIGGLSAGAPRELAVSLDRLGAATREATLWDDAPEAEVDPNRLRVRTQRLQPGDPFRVRIGTDGGFVAELKQAAVRP